MAQTPDGRFFGYSVGNIACCQAWHLIDPAFITLNVNVDGERGLLGVAVDPDFVNNQYVYLCYTVPSGAFNRVSRFTASGDTVVPGSEVVIIDLDSLIANYHGGGHLGFGPDGKLYIATGENGRSYKSQDIDSYLGKILRINSDGSVPVDNPIPGPGKRDHVWAYGLRNPFTFAFQPGTGRLFVDDVGEVTWEEINDITSRRWKLRLACCGRNEQQSLMWILILITCMESIRARVAPLQAEHFQSGYNNYPAALPRSLFFTSITAVTGSTCLIWMVPNMVKLLLLVSQIIPLLSWPDLMAICTSFRGTTKHSTKLPYTSVQSPVIVNQPLSQLISTGFGYFLSHSKRGRDTELSMVQRRFSYFRSKCWLYTIPSVAFTDSGYYHVTVTNGFGNTVSNDAHLSVTSNQPPVAVIDTPLANSFYTAGDVIHFHGSANDPEDGMLPDTGYHWLVVFHHDTCASGTYSRSECQFRTFTIGNVGKNQRMFLSIVSDCSWPWRIGWLCLCRSVSSCFTTHTQLTTIRTHSVVRWTTIHNSIFCSKCRRHVPNGHAPNSQLYGTTNMVFTHWDNGGSLSQTFTTPVNDTVFTAYYDSLQLSYHLGNDTTVCIGDTIVLDAGNYQNYLWTNGSLNQSIQVTSATPTTIITGVTVTDGNGLVGNDSITIVFDVCDGIQALENSQVSIFPNPTTGEFSIGPAETRLSIHRHGYFRAFDLWQHSRKCQSNKKSRFRKVHLLFLYFQQIINSLNEEMFW